MLGVEKAARKANDNEREGIVICLEYNGLFRTINFQAM